MSALYYLNVTIHILAAMLWLGGMFFLGVLPDFATWRTTRGSQGFDARTFEVRARPAKPIEGARPGMSVIVESGA